MSGSSRQIVFLGFPLDPDERQAVIDRKLYAGPLAWPDDPYEGVMALLRAELPPGPWLEAGSQPVPVWLRPLPPPAVRDSLAVENFVGFLDGGGCRAAVEHLAETVTRQALPGLPCLIGVDHCLSGGPLLALARAFGPENLTLVILDAHLDAVPMPVMAGAIAYDIEHNPTSPYDPHDPFIFGRPDSYNASTFLHHLLEEGALLPQNLILAGLGDYPPKQALAAKDQRLRDYAGVWTGLQKRGARLVTKQDLGLNPAKLATFLRQIKTSHLYVSIDLDVGAGAATGAVRFDERVGLTRAQVMKTAAAISQAARRGPGQTILAGLDVMEFNSLHADAPGAYRLAADLIKTLVFG